MRRHPAESPGVRVEAEERVTRTVGTDGSWSAVVWSRLTDADADEVIAAEIARSGGSFEWKLYSHDRPADLPERLRSAGLTPEPMETLMVAEIADLDLPAAPPEGVRVRTVEDDAGVDHDAPGPRRGLRRRLGAPVGGGGGPSVAGLAAAADRGGDRVGRRPPRVGGPGRVPRRDRLRQHVGRRHAAGVARARRF